MEVSVPAYSLWAPVSMLCLLYIACPRCWHSSFCAPSGITAWRLLQGPGGVWRSASAQEGEEA